jgi:hypothetical protein
MPFTILIVAFANVTYRKIFKPVLSPAALGVEILMMVFFEAIIANENRVDSFWKFFKLMLVVMGANLFWNALDTITWQSIITLIRDV